MNRAVSKDDHEAALGWLDRPLESARSEGRTRLVKLPDLVRAEILFDVNASESPRSVRNRAPTGQPAPGAGGI